jgi:hypothetical protein
MHVIRARNVNDAYQQGILLLAERKLWDSDQRESRAGNVVELDEPVTTVYRKPLERVLWDAKRDCNPFFHLYEAIWMLAGRNDVESLARFNKKMSDFSDDSEHFHGAYGFRWRHWFGFDQLHEVVEQLKESRGTRRAILTMWSPNGDMIQADGGAGGGSSLDLPCNMIVKFCARNGVLNMMVYNRSNDMIWGAYGANAVHFAFLQEYVAVRVGLPVGRYWQISGNYHAYTDVWGQKVRGDLRVDEDRYLFMKNPRIVPLCAPGDIWNSLEEAIQDAADLDNAITGIGFFDDVFHPLMDVWAEWKKGDRGRALAMAHTIQAGDVDWVIACIDWMQRRALK